MYCSPLSSWEPLETLAILHSIGAQGSSFFVWGFYFSPSLRYGFCGVKEFTNNPSFRASWKRTLQKGLPLKNPPSKAESTLLGPQKISC